MEIHLFHCHSIFDLSQYKDTEPTCHTILIVLIFQYINKLPKSSTTTIISLGHFWSYCTIEKMSYGFLTKVLRTWAISGRHFIERQLSDKRHIKTCFILSALVMYFTWGKNLFLFPLITPVYLQNGVWSMFASTLVSDKQPIKQLSLKSFFLFYGYFQPSRRIRRL